VSEKLVNLKKQPKSPNPINKAAKAKSLGPLQIKYQNISDNIHPTLSYKSRKKTRINE
jgi:hypothetical protein